MAGLSKRFFDAGYKKPKYMLEIGTTSVFENSIKSFANYFESDLFVFVIRDVYDTKVFVDSKARKCGIKNYHVIELDRETSGQAESVALALATIGDDTSNEEMYIFNIDTFLLHFEKPNWKQKPDGYLETFIGSGKNWSNVEPAFEGSDMVKKTAEKEEISDYCCTGLYYWKSVSLYCETFLKYYSNCKLIKKNNETYIAPMYNLLIENLRVVRFTVIPKELVIFCGTPVEYLECINRIK